MIRFFVLITLIAICCLSGFAQAGGSTGEIRGRIADPNDAVVSGATVTVTDADKGVSRTVTTDADGQYRFLALTPGTYQLRVEAAGFGSQVQNAIEVTVGKTADQDFALQIGDASATVEVTGDPPVIETDRSQQSTTVNERYIRELPIDRRDYLTFTLLAPGVVDSNALADNTDFRVAQTPNSGISFYGNNGRGNSITVDGAEANDQGGGVRSTLSQEAVQEFQINRSNYNAELGGASGGVINIISKTGSNDFHGSVFGYFRNQNLDAGDPFAFVLDGNTLTRIKPDANRQQYGFTVGGPINKDRTFFFGGYEGLRRRESSTVPLLTNLNIFNPTAAQATVISALAASTVATPVQCLTSMPTLLVPRAACAGILQGVLTADQPTIDLFRNNSGVFPFDTDSHAASFRADHVPNSSNSFFVRYSFTDREESNQSTRALLAFSRSNNVDVLDHNIAGGWTHIFNADVSNELRLQFNYNELFVTSNDPNGPELNIAGFGFFNRDIFLPSFNFDRRYEIVDNFSVVSGDHRIKFGGSFLLRNGFFDAKTFFSGRFGFGSLPGRFISPFFVVNPANSAQDIPINGLQAFDLGLPQSYQQGFGDGIVGGKLPYFSIYAQDTWKARSNLTLNYGLRYEIDGRREPLPTFKKNFGPRVGFAWDPYKDGKSIVRGGYGIFYAQIPFVIDYVVQSLNEIDGVRQIPQVLTTLNAANPFALNGPINIFRTLRAQGVIGIPNTIRTITPADLVQFGIPVSQTGPRNPLTVLFRADPTYRNPRAQQASFGFEQELAPGFSLGVSYVWALTQFITRARDINLLDRPIGARGIREYGTSPDCAGALSVNCFRNPLLFQEIIYEAAASANYHGVILEFNKQFGRNIAISGNYTYSEANDQVTDYNSDFRAFDQRDDSPEYSLSAFDQRHKFVIYGIFQSPFENVFLRDFTLTPIFRANSGRPFNLLAGLDVNGDRSTNGDRPLLVENGVTLGPIPRNVGLGPSFQTFDMRVTRRLGFSERMSLDLTVEAFNLFNRLNFASVNNTVGPSFPTTENVRGRADVGPSTPLGFTSAFDPRRIQLGAKFRF
ncbi:MAG: carboxypeptidase regulatory-like domain-containing protein [Acidobacteriota bacterium]|nr:carboxypeptidase regulatory-like domain-containing protein [Acidobacteriota bacterium]